MQNTEKIKIASSKASNVRQSPTRRGRRAGAIPFPRNSLDECLKIANAIWTKNAGEPTTLINLAFMLNMTPNSGSFNKLVRSTYRYGIINETFSQKSESPISITELGRTIVCAEANDDTSKYKLTTLKNVPVFKKFLEQLDTKIIPEKHLCKQLLKSQSHVIDDDLDSCYEVLMKNIENLGLIQESKGEKYLRISHIQSLESSVEDGLQKEDLDELETTSPDKSVKTEDAPCVFIGHSKNTNILEQIKDVLGFGSLEYHIAEEEESTAIPIPEKIFGLMRKCNCAIINISADEQEKQNEEYRINQNVLIEIGAAFLAYNKKVILLVDERIGELPSNLKGISQTRYKGEELTWDAGTKLQKALAKFRDG